MMSDWWMMAIGTHHADCAWRIFYHKFCLIFGPRTIDARSQERVIFKVLAILSSFPLDSHHSIKGQVNLHAALRTGFLERQ